MSARGSRSWRGSLLGLLLLPALAACGDDDPTGPQNPEDVEFAEVLGIDLADMTRLESGVYVMTTREGVDPAVEAGSTVRLNYSLWLPDGSPIQAGALTRALTGLIEGFALGLVGMKTTEIRWIVIPSELAYGALGAPGIPPHSVLVFQVEMLEVT